MFKLKFEDSHLSLALFPILHILLQARVVGPGALKSQEFGKLDMVLFTLQYSQAQGVSIKLRDFFVLLGLFGGDAGEEVDSLSDEDSLKLREETSILKGFSGYIEAIKELVQ